MFYFKKNYIQENFYIKKKFYIKKTFSIKKKKKKISNQKKNYFI